MRCATCKAPTADEITPHLYYGFLIKPQADHSVIFGSAEPEIPEALRVQVGNQYAFVWRKGQLPNKRTPHVLNVSVAPAATTSALLSNYASEFPVGKAGAWVESGVLETAVYETVQRTLYPFAGQVVAVRETIGTVETLTYLYNDHPSRSLVAKPCALLVAFAINSSGQAWEAPRS